MASENKNENVLLEGQTAYFKKNGSMRNLGVVTANTPDSSSVYENGYIAEGSVIKGTTLELSTDYTDTEREMRTFLGEFFDENVEGYKVQANAEKITTELAPYCTKFKEYAKRTNSLTKLPYLTTLDNNIAMNITMSLPINYTMILDITSNAKLNESYNIFSSEDNTVRLYKSEDNLLYYNDTQIDMGDKGFNCRNKIVINQIDGKISIYVNGKLKVNNINGSTEDKSVNIFKKFIGTIYSVKLIDEDTEKLVTVLKPYINRGVGEGLLEIITSTMYIVTEGEVYLYKPCTSIYMQSNSFIDTLVSPNANTGIEIDFKTSSNSNQIRIFGVGSDISVSNSVTFELYRNGSGRWAYARNDNKGNWVDTNVDANNSRTVCSINKQNDGKIIMSGGATVNATLSGTVTNSNNANQTIWLNTTNDLVAYTRPESKTYISGSSYTNIYSLKVWDGDELIRNMVPGTDIISNRACLFDKVNKKSYYASKGGISISDS